MTNIIAHRGYAKKYPENTLLAFKHALDTGADGIEFDVHLTKDDQLAVHHGYYLSKTSHDNEEISNLDYKSLQVKGLPLLEDVLKQLGSTTHYEIELRGYTEDFLRKVAKTIHGHGLEGDVECTSPHSYVLTQIRKYLPNITTGMFACPAPGWMNKPLWQAINLNNALLGDISVIHGPLGMLDENS